jgi:hypothetical protein
MSDNNNNEQEELLDQKLLRLGKELLQKTSIRLVDCDFCNSKGSIGVEKEVPEDFYQKFPEERDSGGSSEYYHICLKCYEKTRRNVFDLERENPSLFKELEAGELSPEQAMDGLGDQVFRPLKDD